jgi:hypothetical protein
MSASPSRAATAYPGADVAAAIERLLDAVLTAGRAALEGAPGHALDASLRRRCRDALELLCVRQQAIARLLRRPARLRQVAPPGNPRRWTFVTEQALELDVATADVARKLLDVAESEWLDLQSHAQRDAGERSVLPAWPPAPTVCAAAIRWAVEGASTELPVRLTLLRIGGRVLVPLFLAEVLAGSSEGADTSVPATWTDAPTAPAPVQDARHEAGFDAAQPGEWFHMLLGEGWVNARLTWRSSNSLFYMFSSNRGGRAHSMTRGTLERMLALGQIRRRRLESLDSLPGDPVVR